MLSWNIRSLPLRYTTLSRYVIQNRPAIICLQEAFPNSRKNKRDKLPPRLSGYHSYHLTSGQGLVTYIRHSIPHSLIKNSPLRSSSSLYQLFRIIINDSPMFICNVYLHPRDGDVTILPTKPSHPIFYLGDFNAAHPSFGGSKITSSGNKLVTFTATHNLRSFPTTHPTHVSGGYLDLVFGNNVVNEAVSVSIVPTLLSDHNAVLTTYSIPIIHAQNRHVRRKLNIPVPLQPTFKAVLTSWYNANSFATANELYTSIVTQITNFHDHYVLQANHKPGGRKRHCWATDRRIRESEDNVTRAAATYRSDRTSDTLHSYITAARDLRTLSNDVRQEYWDDFLQALNAHTPSSQVWKFINRVTKSGSQYNPPLHHNPLEYANSLIRKWSDQSQTSFLPNHTQARLLSARTSRLGRISEARATPSPCDDYLITEEELRLALTRGKATAPGDDGITYATLRLLSQIPGNPLLTLFNMSLSEGTLPAGWTRSTIIPIPKPNSTDYRPISLTSCVSKVMERILLARLRHLIGDKLNPNLFGFLPGRSSHHCFAELFSHLKSSSCTAFIDLKAAFDVANRDVILDEIAFLGVSGSLFRWIESYLSNRSSRVLFCGALSNYLPFNLGTPQGGVLSPFLFNVLMNRLLRLLGPCPPSSLILSYADDICISSHSHFNLRPLLRKFADAATSCGLIINTSKTKLFTHSPLSRQQCERLPVTLLDNNLDVVQDYSYLGVPMSSLSKPTEYVSQLRERLRVRLRPLRAIISGSRGVSIPIARKFYILYIRSLLDYHALHLSLLPSHLLTPLETLQNAAMRIIFSCPMSTQVASMLAELDIPPVTDRIHMLGVCFGVQCLPTSPTPIPNFTAHLVNTLSDPTNLDLVRRQHIPSLASWLNRIRSTLCPLLDLPGRNSLDIRHDLLTPIASDPLPPIWSRATPVIHYTPHVKHPGYPSLLAQGSIQETLCTASKEFPAKPIHVYTDGSLLNTGKAGAAVIAFRAGTPIFSTSHRLPNWSSSTQCELSAIKSALLFLTAEQLSGLIISDSQAALAIIHNPQPSPSPTVSSLYSLLHHASTLALQISFVWVPSHVGHGPHDKVDKLARAACLLSDPAIRLPLSKHLVRRIMRDEVREDMLIRTDAARRDSVSIPHYDWYRNEGHPYGKSPSLTRRCDVAIARIRMGYRSVWEVSTRPSPADLTECPLCRAPNSRTLIHYIIDCKSIDDFRPPGKLYREICDFFIAETHVLEDILTKFPDFLRT